MIREFQTEDTDAVVSIWQAANALAHPFLEDAFVAQEAVNLRTMYLPNAETWIVEGDETSSGMPIGFIALIGDEIGGLFLNPSSHGKGYGKALVDHAAGLHGSLRVEVFEKNAIGRRFYDRYGFTHAGQYRHEATGEQVIKMTYAPA